MAQAVGRAGCDFYPPTPVVVQRHPGQITSDAGLLPARQFDAAWRYTDRMAGCLTDARPDRRQSLASMLRQRVFGIVAGYADCDDHRADPVFKFVADDRGRDGAVLASQPTLSRFEDDVLPADLLRLAAFHVATSVERLRDHHGGAVLATVTSDVNVTDDPTHGNQHLALFHAYYRH